MRCPLPGWRRIAWTAIDDVEVSTVEVDFEAGLRHTEIPSDELERYALVLPPMWETMVFGGELSEQQWRWPNAVAALAGHDQVVALVRDVREARQRAEKRRET